MEIPHKAAYVPCAVLLWDLSLALPDCVNVLLKAHGPVMIACIVQAIDLATSWYLYAWVSQHELSCEGVQGETVCALQNKHTVAMFFVVCLGCKQVCSSHILQVNVDAKPFSQLGNSLHC